MVHGRRLHRRGRRPHLRTGQQWPPGRTGSVSSVKGPTGSVGVRVVRPAGATGVLPVILYVHGLGWVFDGPQTHDRLVRELAVVAQAASCDAPRRSPTRPGSPSAGSRKCSVDPSEA